MAKSFHSAGSARVLAIAAVLCALLFIAVAEWTFWEEFQARFNFIAVDYLVYTTEVIGNIRESYAVGWLLPGLAGAALGLFAATAGWRRVTIDSAGFGRSSTREP